MILLALALIGIGIWNMIVGMTAVGWVCFGMVVLLACQIIDEYVRGDHW